MEKINYVLIKSRRKSLSLSIDNFGRITVRAPIGMTKKAIDEFVYSKREWIEEKLGVVSVTADAHKELMAKLPETLPFMGSEVKVSTAEPYGYYDGEFHLPVEFTLERLLPYLDKLYRRLAVQIIVPRVYRKAQEMGMEVSDVKINSAKTRWGSCSGKKTINLSRRLMAASEEEIDYVIVHELCHTVHMDHSRAFWELVESYVPDRKRVQDKLSQTQKRLEVLGL